MFWTRNSEYSTLVVDAQYIFNQTGAQFCCLDMEEIWLRLPVCCVITEHLTGGVLLSQRGHVMWAPELILWLLPWNVPDYSLKLHSWIAFWCGDKLTHFVGGCHRIGAYIFVQSVQCEKEWIFVLRQWNSNLKMYFTSFSGVPVRSQVLYNGLGVQWWGWERWSFQYRKKKVEHQILLTLKQNGRLLGYLKYSQFMSKRCLLLT